MITRRRDPRVTPESIARIFPNAAVQQSATRLRIQSLYQEDGTARKAPCSAHADAWVIVDGVPLQSTDACLKCVNGLLCSSDGRPKSFELIAGEIFDRLFNEMDQA